MSSLVKKNKQALKSYFQMNCPDIIDLGKANAFESDILYDPFMGSKPPYSSNKIVNYRQIQNWENYFLCSAICSVGKALGSEFNDYQFYAAFTGDMFTYMYSQKAGNPDNLKCDGGLTNYFFIPQLVKKAYAVFGYDCIYLSNLQIKQDFHVTMNAIKASVDKGIPVLAWGMGNVTILAWGMGNVTLEEGGRYDPLPEACLIGGYDENDDLYVNLYGGPERLPEGSVDEYGYSTIAHGLDTTNGLFFAGEKLKDVNMRQVYQSVIDSIPAFLTLDPSDSYLGGKYVFGKTAFETWANTLITDSYFENKTDEELVKICWNLHCSPYCSVCTTSAYDFFKDMVEQYPDLTMAVKLLPLYEKMQNYRQEIWDLQGDFFPSMDKFRMHEFRAKIADILQCMGGICEDILKAYE